MQSLPLPIQKITLYAIFNFFRYLFFVFGSNTLCICNRNMYLLDSWFLFDFMTPKSLCAGMYSKVQHKKFVCFFSHTIRKKFSNAQKKKIVLKCDLVRSLLRSFKQYNYAMHLTHLLHGNMKTNRHKDKKYINQVW